jgi:hypothetical protein
MLDNEADFVPIISHNCECVRLDRHASEKAGIDW